MTDAERAAYEADKRAQETRIRREGLFRLYASDHAALLDTDWQHPSLKPYAEQIRRVMAWDGRFPGLFLTGPTGRGKTRLLFALMRRLMVEDGRDVWFSTSQRLAAKIAECQSYSRDDAGELIAAINRHEIVMIDDLGQEAVARYQADRVDAWFFDLFDRRLGSRKPMVVTSNLNAAQMAGTRQVGHDPFLRRLMELCGKNPVKFT